MITIYKSQENGLIPLDKPTHGCWINVINPTQEETSWLESLNIPQDYITYALDLDERPRTERENGELLILMRIPVFLGPDQDTPYNTIPLGIILNDQFVITVCKRENDILQELISGRVRSLATGKRNRFILRILLNTANKYLVYLREINKTVEAIEDKLQLSTRNREVLELLMYQKSLTYFTTALKANELMLERLHRSQFFRTYPDDEDLLEDVITENQQAIEMTNISSNILSSMMDAFASIISNNLNVVMKFLTSFTIVLSIPVMISSFFGMNVPIPMEGHPAAFLVIFIISILLSLSIAYLFMKKDWF